MASFISVLILIGKIAQVVIPIIISYHSGRLMERHGLKVRGFRIVKDN